MYVVTRQGWSSIFWKERKPTCRHVGVPEFVSAPPKEMSIFKHLSWFHHVTQRPRRYRESAKQRSLYSVTALKTVTSLTYARYIGSSLDRSNNIFIRMYIFHAQTEYKKIIFSADFRGNVFLHVYIPILQSSTYVFQLNKVDETRNNCIVSVSCYIAQLLFQCIITLCLVFSPLLAWKGNLPYFDAYIPLLIILNFIFNQQAKICPW